MSQLLVYCCTTLFDWTLIFNYQYTTPPQPSLQPNNSHRPIDAFYFRVSAKAICCTRFIDKDIKLQPGTAIVRLVPVGSLFGGKSTVIGCPLFPGVPVPSTSFSSCTVPAINSYCLWLVGWGLLYVRRNRRLFRDGSPGQPPRLSHSSWWWWVDA